MKNEVAARKQDAGFPGFGLLWLLTGEKRNYIPDPAASDGRAKVIYQSKDGRDRKVFPALDWLAQLTTHIPNRREHMVRYGACPALDPGKWIRYCVPSARGK